MKIKRNSSNFFKHPKQLTKMSSNFDINVGYCFLNFGRGKVQMEGVFFATLNRAWNFNHSNM